MKLGVILEQGGSLETMRSAGQEDRLLYYFERYRRAFTDVVFFSYGDRGVSRAGAARVVPCPRGISPSFYSLGLPWLAREELASCDVIRGLQTSASLPAVLTKKRHGVPCVITFGYDARKLPGQRMPRLNLWLARRYADVVVCTTETLRGTMAALAPRSRLELIGNGVDLTVFTPRPVRREREGRWKILSVGRLSAEKNHALLIDAAASVADVELHLIGSGPEASRLEARAKDKGVSLVLHGTLPQSGVVAQLALADVFALTSRSEGHPKALLEAMACQRPCVGTNVTGIRDVLIDGESGLLVEATEGALAGAIRSLVTDRALAERLAQRARATIEDQYDLDKLITQEITVLESLLRDRHA